MENNKKTTEEVIIVLNTLGGLLTIEMDDKTTVKIKEKFLEYLDKL